MQTLRENIHQEYREVVERRVFTGFNLILVNANGHGLCNVMPGFSITLG